MNFNKILYTLLSIYTTFAFAIDGYVNITISAPSFSENEEPTLEDFQVEIGSYFTPNHQFYPLTPELNTKNAKQNPISWPLWKEIPRGKLLSLQHTIPKQGKNSPISISITSDSESFALIPIHKNQSPIPIKIYLVDLTCTKLTPSKIEVVPNKRYRADQAGGKTLFILLPNKGWVSFQTVNFNNYTIPLEVTYHSP